ncbi:anticodon nuclease [Simiduia curdlanivorans]|uniref:Anticodon nuclease n=1 Tax=Simiduia curdlanivorans TaxID=1492769 RepID=A0ABV8V6R3_9GAMM|nr:anticodon nuclease [Simiduia curdlanivorans]MDN3638414.1 anticodon nuclease [Simiduia curdlanivorans]
MSKKKGRSSKRARKMENKSPVDKQPNIGKGGTVDDQPGTLSKIAEQLKVSDKKVQLIYAFNGMGKTRLSRAFKELVTTQTTNSNDGEESELSRSKILYYNAFTEDLFYWDNDLENDAEPKLKIQPNSFTDWILKEQGQDRNIVTNFQRYANDKLTPRFNEEYKTKDKDDKEVTVKAFSEVTFSLARGDNAASPNLKISKGEESNFIWSIFQTLIDQVISILNVVEPEQRETRQFDQLEYVFIDDPVSSLDENHLIELAVTLGELIKSCQSQLKFIITTHSPLFFNVLHNELNSKACYLLERFEDGSFALAAKQGDSNKSFSYHLHLKQTLEKAITENSIQKYHFTLLRNLYEKTANFLGYDKWTDLLDTAPGDKQGYLTRIIQFSSHRTLSSEEVAEPTNPEKQMVRLLLDNLLSNYGFLQQEQKHG